MIKKIKQIGRKYLAPAIVGLNLALGANAYAKETKLPVKQEIKKDFVAQDVNEYNACLKYAEEKFNEYIKDRKFSSEEQEDVYNNLKKAYDMEKKYSQLNLPEENKKLYKLLKSNIKHPGIIGVKSDLERELKKDEIYVDVEKNPFIIAENLLYFGIPIGAIVIYVAYLNREANRGK